MALDNKRDFDMFGGNFGMISSTANRDGATIRVGRVEWGEDNTLERNDGEQGHSTTATKRVGRAKIKRGPHRENYRLKNVANALRSYVHFGLGKHIIKFICFFLINTT